MNQLIANIDFCSQNPSKRLRHRGSFEFGRQSRYVQDWQHFRPRRETAHHENWVHFASRSSKQTVGQVPDLQRQLRSRMRKGTETNWLRCVCLYQYELNNYGYKRARRETSQPPWLKWLSSSPTRSHPQKAGHNEIPQSGALPDGRPDINRARSRCLKHLG
jgi:hypothetical protein